MIRKISGMIINKPSNNNNLNDFISNKQKGFLCVEDVIRSGTGLSKL